jgi:hypothetical protein
MVPVVSRRARSDRVCAKEVSGVPDHVMAVVTLEKKHLASSDQPGDFFAFSSSSQSGVVAAND